ncbi:MAG: hypothetical protein J0L82_03085 [Deltaproteobacteria bacterium]|nr:hypothetical protein [Deltaproteobacteria bacterium]
MKSGFSCSSRFLIGIVLCGIVGIVGCSPQPVVRQFKDANQDFGPGRRDGDLDVDSIAINSLPTMESLNWRGEVETSKWYRVSEDLGWLSRQLEIPQIGKISVQMRGAVMRSALAWQHSVSNSAYMSAAIGETRQDSEQAINSGVVMLTAQQPLISDLLAKRNAETNWSSERVSLVDLLAQIEDFLVRFVKEVEVSSVDEQVKKQLVTELRINFGPKISRIRAQVALAYNEEKVYDFVAKIRAVLKSEDIDLGKELNKQLDMAERLPRNAEKIRNAKGALSVLIDFWLASSPETRNTEFKPVSPELYDFFKDQSEEDLDCLKRSCGFLTVIKRELFILPQIEEYGVRKLRKKLVEAAELSIKSELEKQAVAFLPTLHTEVAKMVNGELQRQSENILKISRDYGAYLRVAMNRMAVAKLGVKEKATFSGVEPNRLRVDVNFGRGGIQVSSSATTEDFKTGASAIGSGIALAIEHFEHHVERELQAGGVNPIRIKQLLSKTLFEQINKVLMIGGFKTETAKPFEALALTVDRDLAARSRFNLRNQMDSPFTFAVPDAITVTKPATAEDIIATTMPRAVTVSVGGQADLLRGLSQLAIRLKDWEQSGFDQTLGPIVLADFVPDLPREAVDQKLFPKDLFFAATIGNAAVILQNVTKKSSTVGLISSQKKLRWANEPLGSGTVSVGSSGVASGGVIGPAEQETMAAVFDLVNGERAKEARVGDVARFLSALTVFLKAVENIEQTKSPVLLGMDGSGVSPLDQFVGGRSDIKLLVMAIANFLSKEVRELDGLVRPLYVRSDSDLVLGPRGQPRLLDQALVIRALLDASEAISAKVYKNEAMDLLAATNSSFFRPGNAFYSNRPDSDESPDFEALAAMLVAGERMKPHMSSSHLSQWKKLSKPWIGALRDAAETLP